MYYILLLISAMLFSLQFFCQQKYEQRNGTEVGAALSFSLYKGLAVMVMMFVIGKFKIEFTGFSFWLSGVYALCYILMIYFSLKAFSVANLSVYSVFTMLGGMTLPFVVGVTLYSEDISVFKIICCLLIVIAVLLNIQKGQSSKKAFLYYMLVFVLNGSVGVISKVHQASSIPHVDSTSCMFWSGMFTVIICCIWLKLSGNKIPFFKDMNLVYSAGDGFLNGIGDLILFIAVIHIPASVQYPLVTGGVMVFSTIISILRKEKLRKLEYLAAAIAFVSSVLMAF